MNRFKYLVFLTAVAALTVSSYAVPTLTLSDGNPADTVTVVDGGAGDSNPMTGVVTYGGSIGSNWFLNVSTGIANPPAGNNVFPMLDLDAIDMSLGAGALTVTWSDTFVGAPSGNINAAIGGTLSGSSLLFTGSENSSVITTLGTYSAPASGTDSFGAMVQDPGLILGETPTYTLTETIIITASSASQTSYNANLDVTPVSVPDNGATALLIGLGLAGIGLGMYARRRQLAKV